MTAGSRFALLVALFGLALGGAACSGGGSSVGSTGVSCGSGDEAGQVLCLTQCNLGCSSTGCATTDIAQNQIILLQFSEPVDANSVNSSSIRFRTPTGAEPVGEFFVNGSLVEFVPTLSISGGQTFFGFTAGETYTMTIVGGPSQPEVVRSTSGKPFIQTLSCTLRSSLGIIDLNNVPPRAELVVPTLAQIESAPRDTQIKLEFNELIDATPFLTGTQSPVEFSVRRTRAALGGGFECDPNSQPQTLNGSQTLSFDAGRGVSVLTFVPSQALPGNVCVEISVTDGVTDLSGRPAQPQTFVFRTEVVPLTEQTIVEEFDDDSQLDTDASAGQWANGIATFAKIGGDGRHGDFSTSLAFDTDTFVDGKRVFELNCDNTIIPPSNTTTGAALVVNDGRFFFSTFVLPSDARLRFVGNSPPVITVAGRCDIRGDIEVVGQSILSAQLPSSNTGQPGALGGIFGGDGGRGGDKCLGVGPGNGAFNGQNGEDVSLLAGHGYLGSRLGTGGRGSALYPASGLNQDQQFPVMPPTGLMYCLSATAGGSGGGLFQAGAIGRVVSVLQNNLPIANESSYMGVPSTGGTAVQLFPFPAPTGLQQSSLHFLVGGSGGGGSGSNATLSLSLARSWAPGSGGGGGAGAFALRAGRSLRVGQNGRLLAVGGNAIDNIGSSAGAQVAPAGGGSGGSIVLQSAGTAEIIGLIDVRGGRGGIFDRTGGGGAAPGGGRVIIHGGDGSPGFVRLEQPSAPQTSALSSMQPAATPQNVGVLTEVDSLVSVRSAFYSTGSIFGPEFARYEIYATVDGQQVVFSDDPAISPIEAAPGQAVRALFQAGTVDLLTGEATNLRPWRASVRSSSNQIGIASDGLNGFRFMLFVDRTFAANVTIDRVVVVYRN